MRNDQRRLLLATACLSLSILLLGPGRAAALTGEEAACRDAIAKTMAGYTSTLAKLVVSCNQRRSSGDRPLGDDCNDVDVADSAGLLASVRTDVRSRITSACGAGATTLLATYSECPAPAASADNGGATNGIDDFDEVVDCEIALADAHIGGLMNAAEGHPSERLLKPVEKCQRSLGKGTSRIVRTYMQERRRCQREKDSGGGTTAYTCGSDDSRGHIAKAGTRFAAKMHKVCSFSPEILAKLEACDDDSDGLITCARAAAEGRGAELIRDAYVLDGTTNVTTTTNPDVTTTMPGVTTTLGIACGDTAPTCNGDCPTGQTCLNESGTCTCIDDGNGPCADATIFRTIHGKYGPVLGSRTSLSTGWSGQALDVEIPDQTGDVIDVSCDEHCENCQIDMNFRAAGDAANCRCTADPTQACHAINGSDSASCGTTDPTCRCYFGAPLPLSSGGTPACVVNRIRQDYAGTMNLRTGEWHDEIRLASIVYLGTDTAAPCPTCVGDDVWNDGVRHGTCSSGGACDTNGNHATFGPTSWDCFPASPTNISGTGLLIPLNSSTGSQSLDGTLHCDTPNTSNDCPCRVCSGNGLFGCSSNAECAAAGFGTCTDGGGAGVVKNTCTDFLCQPDGRCDDNGPDDLYCSNPVHPDGRGFVPCTGDTDCDSGATCTVSDRRRCFPDPIVVSGEADRYNPTSAGIFCIAPTSTFAINSAAGLPGPGTLAISFTSDIRCKTDPTVVYQFPAGANCPGGTVGTTTTTLLPLPTCAEADAPSCGGTCGTGQACTVSTTNTDLCECTGIPLPACVDAMAPACGGFCDNPTDLCQANGDTCACLPATLPQCDGATTPLCGGLCPTGELCQSAGNECLCGAPGPPNCTTQTAPACGGVCDVGFACEPNSGLTACVCVNLGLPTCGSSNADAGCVGTCSLGSLCQNVLGNCQCVSIPLTPPPLG